MDIFISWSGPRSHAVASALHKWLPKIVNAFKPWLSSEIDKGTRWRSDIANRLQDARAGIICLTPSNLHADWILFEAGALSKQIENTFVCTLLIGLEPTDVKDPLAQFQATRLNKSEILELLKTLNISLNTDKLSESHVEEAFDVWWPKLEAELNKLPDEHMGKPPEREERDLLEEILELVRTQNRTLPFIIGSGAPINVAANLVAGQSIVPGMIPGEPILASHSEKTRSVLPATVTKEVHRIAQATDPNVTRVETQIRGNVYLVTISTTTGKQYRLSLPADIKIEQLESLVIRGMTNS